MRWSPSDKGSLSALEQTLHQVRVESLLVVFNRLEPSRSGPCRVVLGMSTSASERWSRFTTSSADCGLSSASVCMSCSMRSPRVLDTSGANSSKLGRLPSMTFRRTMLGLAPEKEAGPL